MLARLGLPRPQIATKLYGAIAAALGIIFVLVAVTTNFASQTAEVVNRFHTDGYGIVLLSSRIGELLSDNRRQVALAARIPEHYARQQDEQFYQSVTAEISSLLEQLGFAAAHPLSRRFAIIASQGEAVFDLARKGDTERHATAAQYAASVADLKQRLAHERKQQVHAAEEKLDYLVSHSRALVSWVCAAAATTGLLLGPIGLMLLRRVLRRLQGIGSALLRLARNDTSVEIPDLSATDELGQFARSVAVFKAKSIELLQKKTELERLNVQLDAALNNMPMGLSMFDAQERLLVCNNRYSQMYELPNVLTRPGTAHCVLWDYRTKQGATHSYCDEVADPGVGKADLHANMTIEFGKDRIISVSRQPLKGGGWVSLHEDITERRRQEQETIHLARHDPLTNLANRALFRDQLQQHLLRLGRGQGFAVLCLDLDHFKGINDTLGHPVGDALLKQVSERLLSCVRQGDLVARLGGDEFAVIQANVRDAEQTETLASRIVETIGRPFDIDGQRVDTSTSIGITLAPRDGAEADRLLKNADLALYRTKADGRKGYSFFKPEMHDSIEVRRTLELDLRRAIDREELELIYQPIVCLSTRRITGFEALLQWTHPLHGTIPQAEFVSLAEQTGAISQLGAWALMKACAQAARWSQPVRVAINLSPLQIKRNLVDLVLQALAASGLPPERLELEITELALLQDSQNTLAMLHQLRQVGVRTAMDDFGTGYCSLSYLRSFPFDKVKIDKAFISDLERSEHSCAIVQTVIALGKSLGMAALAGGIETHEQQRLLHSWGCAEAQGYFFGPAIPPEQVDHLLADTFASVLSAA